MATGTRAQPSRVEGPTVWEAADHADPSGWTVALDGGDLAALAGEDGALAERPLVGRLKAALDGGPGFLVVEGMPVHDEERAIELLLRLGAALGPIVPQTKDGAPFSRVQAETGGRVRGARTTRALLYHSDFAGSVPDAIGLLAVRAAKEGGESLVVSGHTVHDVLLERDPESLARLYEPFCFDRSGYVEGEDQPVLEAPVFERDGDRVLTLYNRARLHRGHLVTRRPLDERALRALDAFDAVLAEERYVLRFTLAPGSMLFTNNRVIVHNRTAYADHDDPSRKRLLIRMWMGA
jgi:alpha-ketoglutarate-dependent taurine dioxygenase